MKVFIDINNIPELHRVSIKSSGITVGANISLTEWIQVMLRAAERYNVYQYCRHIANHIELIAHIPVRNVSKYVLN